MNGDKTGSSDYIRLVILYKKTSHDNNKSRIEE